MKRFSIGAFALLLIGFGLANAHFRHITQGGFNELKIGSTKAQTLRRIATRGDVAQIEFGTPSLGMFSERSSNVLIEIGDNFGFSIFAESLFGGWMNV